MASDMPRKSVTVRPARSRGSAHSHEAPDGKAAAPRRRRSADQMRLLSQAALLEEAPPPRLLTRGILVLVLLVAGALAWAGMATVTVSATSPGEVVPAGSVHRVQHFEGGIVEAVAVRDGQQVERGETLVRLESAGARAEAERARARLAALSFRAARLRSLIEDAEPDFGPLAARYPEMAADERAVLASVRAAAAGQAQVLERRIALRQAELATLEEQANSLTAQIAVLEEELAIRRTLFERGHGSRVVLLDAQRDMATVQGRLAETLSAQREARLAIAEAEAQLAESDSDRHRRASEALSETLAELAEVREMVAEAEDRVARLAIRAPVDGMVNGLTVDAPGQVIEPGQTVLEVVPTGDRVIVESRVSPADIGHLAVGQPAEVAVDGFDVARYGMLAGEVDYLSPDSLLDAEGRPYFAARIELADHAIALPEQTQPVLPGMTVQATIKTGSQTVLAYLAGPIHRALQQAFSER
jgi:HlyD family secretion protein/adhesin transport system membrane fusion protein